MTMKITMGTDPELFAVGTDAHLLSQIGLEDWCLGQVVPGYFALGTRNVDNPDMPLPFGQVRPDGAAVEYTVEPTDSVDVMVDRLRQNMHSIEDMVAGRGCRLTVEPRAFIDKRFIDRLDESFGKACSLQIFGCNPEICVYDDLEEPDRPDPRTYPYRTTGGHIHIGVGQRFASDMIAVHFLTAMLDAVIGTAGTYLSNSEQARKRKELYGMPGLIRADDVRGTVEYRCLPAQVLIQTPQLSHMFFTAAQNVARFMVDVYESAQSQREAIEHFRNMVGDYPIIMERANAIMRHDTTMCRDLQLSMVAKTEKDGMRVGATVEAMMNYKMPEHFNIMWR